MERILYIIRYFIIMMVCCGASCTVFAAEKQVDKNVIIVLDPGHGSAGSGADATFDGKTVKEEELNLRISTYLMKELETYDGVTVIRTRDDAYDVDLEERTQIAVDAAADVMISLHCNAYGPNAAYDHGSTVLVARGQYKEALAEKEQELGASILYELSVLGLEDQGLLVRDSTNGECYDNDIVADYYAIIRNGIKNNLMSVLIEHAFMDNEEEYEAFLSSDEKLEKLAKANARGIARYFSLVKKHKNDNEKPEVRSDSQLTYDDIENVKEKFLYIVDDNPKHNQYYEKIFFVIDNPTQYQDIEIPFVWKDKPMIDFSYPMNDAKSNTLQNSILYQVLFGSVY